MLFKFVITRTTDYEVEAENSDEAVKVALGVKGLKAQAAAVVDENTVDIEFAEDGFGKCPDCGEPYGGPDWTPCGPFLSEAEKFLQSER